MVWFEWDDAKARSNERKHGGRFEDAMLVFADPFALVEQDRIQHGELRWQTLGQVGGVALLLVPHGSQRPGRRNDSHHLRAQSHAKGTATL